MAAKLSAPWVTFYRELEALFKEDEQIKVVLDEDAESPVIKIYVDNNEKQAALSQILPTEKVFGSVTVRVNIIPANGSWQHIINLFYKAFEGNPALSFIETVDGVFSNPIHYVVFKNKVVQYFNDNLGDIYGNCSTLYQDIAKDVFGDVDGVCFCTDKEKEEDV